MILLSGQRTGDAEAEALVGISALRGSRGADLGTSHPVHAVLETCFDYGYKGRLT